MCNFQKPNSMWIMMCVRVSVIDICLCFFFHEDEKKVMVAFIINILYIRFIKGKYVLQLE